MKNFISNSIESILGAVGISLTAAPKRVYAVVPVKTASTNKRPF